MDRGRPVADAASIGKGELVDDHVLPDGRGRCGRASTSACPLWVKEGVLPSTAVNSGEGELYAGLQLREGRRLPF